MRVAESEMQKLVDIAKEMCSRYRVLCLEPAGELDYKLLVFSLTWIENFFYVDPQMCSKDATCAEKVIEMHRDVLNYALRGEYIIDLRKEKFLEAVEKLLKIEQPSTP
ncbi:MAG: hypothetical protein QXG81_05200 [Ignisphaera sp.]